jgi:hypothetical protein
MPKVKLALIVNNTSKVQVKEMCHLNVKHTVMQSVLCGSIYCGERGNIPYHTVGCARDKQAFAGHGGQG